MRRNQPARISSLTLLHPRRRSAYMLAKTAGLGVALWLGSGTTWVRADQVELQNGERLAGKVLALTTNVLVIESELLGKVSLPRDQVAAITLGPRSTAPAARLSSSTNQLPRALAAALAKRDPSATAALGQLDLGTNSVRQIQSQLLGDAGPEANQQFNQMVAGLMTGKITVNDLRVQAKAVADQARALRRDGADDPSGMLDAYLAILDDFLRDSAPAAATTNSAASH